MSVDLIPTEQIIEKYSTKKGALIPLLQDVQGVYGYVPKEAVDLIAKKLAIFPVEVYGILTFYTQFYLTPRGKHTIRVCQGTACHVMGGKEIIDYLADTLHVREGGTTEDGVFSLERVACLGCCGMAPVVAI
ncbi:MAG TPA: NAD(P)H-dependent oxidoreductase subunit E, partial [Candidatus Hydrogenedentes bacterium]|nr:NAD(P)H-dependent oxidoreductase subunit E [Candidatus Hydrogenedentota bacterium]